MPMVHLTSRDDLSGWLGLAEHGIDWHCHNAGVAVQALKWTHTQAGCAAAIVAPLLFRSPLGQNKPIKETWRHSDLQGAGRGADESALWLKRD